MHKGEGGYIDFGSLFGDNKEIEDVTDLFEQVRRKEKFEAGKDDWFGAKDLAEVEHSIEALQLEDKLKESLHGDLTANDINTAIQVSIDLKYTAATTNKTVQETIDKYYDQLSEEKQRYVDLSQNLTKEQQQIEEEILKSDKTMGDKAKRAGVINNIVDYHLTRKWESDSKLDSQIEKKFGTKSSLRKQRTLESILEGWAKGKELEIQGATKALQASKNNLVRTIEDKALVETLEKENEEKFLGRKDYISWDEYFMGVSILSAKRSKDPSTQVGACIVDEDKKIVGVGYNGSPRGIEDEDFPWEREGDFMNTKYAYVCHAELNAILNSTKENLKGCTMYVAMSPCNECAKAIVQSGIKKVVYLSDKYKDTSSHKASRKILEMSGVFLEKLKPKNKEL